MREKGGKRCTYMLVMLGCAVLLYACMYACMLVQEELDDDGIDVHLDTTLTDSLMEVCDPPMYASHAHRCDWVRCTTRMISLRLRRPGSQSLQDPGS